MPDDSAASADKLTIRLPPGMRERIRAAAKASGRSLNGEIVASIAAGLDGGGKVDVNVLAERIVDALVARLGARADSGQRARRKRD